MRIQTIYRAAVAASLCLGATVAQVGNEILFVGSSTSGSSDQHVFAESGSGAVLVAAGEVYTDNVTGAVWSDQGRRLYVGQSLMDRVSVADWAGDSASWSTFYSAAGPCYGVEMDAGRGVLWTLAPTSTGTRQLVGLDARLGSPTYGQVLAQTTSLSGALRERWGISPSGNLAAVPAALLGSLDLVDLDPASPTYLQVVVSAPVTGASGLAFSMSAEVDAAGSYAYLLYAGTTSSAIAVYDIAAGAFLDFDPGAFGQQDFVLPGTVANSMDVAGSGVYAVVSGQGGAGWAGRVIFDYGNPSGSVFTPWSGLSVPNADGISLSPDELRAAVTSTATFLSSPSELKVVDVFSGLLLQTATLSSMWNVYTTAWQDASAVASYSVFGSGCAGSLGAPSLAAQAGSRPSLGGTFSLSVAGLPLDLALMATGLSDTATGAGVALPLDLSILGMPGCSQRIDAAQVDVVLGSGGSATWSWSLPSQPSLFGAVFYNQAFVLDPAANAFGWTTSNAGVGSLGF